jgi:hypothetical protein
MSWVRYIIAFVVFMHGMAHLSGYFASWTKADVGFPDRPWLLSKNVTLKSPIGRIFGLLWLVAALALAATGFGLAFSHGWWPTTALIGSAVSLFVILPWLRSVPPGAWAGATFDIGILMALTLPWKDQILQFFS